MMMVSCFKRSLRLLCVIAVLSFFIADTLFLFSYDGQFSVSAYNCVLFGKLSCFFRTLVLSQWKAHPFWSSFSNSEFVLTAASLTAVLTSSYLLRCLINICCLFTIVVKLFNDSLVTIINKKMTFNQMSDSTVCLLDILSNDEEEDDVVHQKLKVLHSRYVKFIFDLSDADLLSQDDSRALLTKLGIALKKVTDAKNSISPELSTLSSGPAKCVICLDECGTDENTKGMCTLEPCGHTVLCSDCAVTVREMSLLCPCCRIPCYSCIQQGQHHQIH